MALLTMTAFFHMQIKMMQNKFFKDIAIHTAKGIALYIQANPDFLVTGDLIRKFWMNAGEDHGDTVLKGPALTVFLKLAESGHILGIPSGEYIKKNNNPNVGTANQDRGLALYEKIKATQCWPSTSEPEKAYDDPVIWNDISNMLGIATVPQPRGCVAVIRGLFENELLIF